MPASLSEVEPMVFRSNSCMNVKFGVKENWVLKGNFQTIVLEDTWKSLGLQGEPTNRLIRGGNWCWSWKLNTLYPDVEVTHLKDIMLGGMGQEEGDMRGWDGLMASRAQWTWVYVDSGNWKWWTGRAWHAVVRECRVGPTSDWAELNLHCIFRRCTCFFKDNEFRKSLYHLPSTVGWRCDITQ